MNTNSSSAAVIGGPTADTQAGDIVVVVVPPDSSYGVKFAADSDGCAAIIESFERLPTGKFGPIQKHGGVHANDVLFEFNDMQLINTKFTEVCRILADKNVLKRELKFMNQKEYYRRK